MTRLGGAIEKSIHQVICNANRLASYAITKSYLLFSGNMKYGTFIVRERGL